jgi:Winged helix-turn-helix DNA-binding
MARIECSACGATADAACECGVAYVPAGVRAAKAVAENPGLSNRVIAAEIGVSEPTVRRARGASCDAPETVIGRDGKQYAATKTDPQPSEVDRWQRSLGNVAGDAVALRAFWTREFGDWQTFEAPSSPVTLAKQAAEAWTQLARDLERKADNGHVPPPPALPITVPPPPALN